MQAPKGSTGTSTVVVEIKLQHVFTARCVRHNKRKLTSRKHTVCFTLFQLFTVIWNYCRKQDTLYADGACIDSRSPQGVAKMIEAIVEVCQASFLIVLEENT